MTFPPRPHRFLPWCGLFLFVTTALAAPAARPTGNLECVLQTTVQAVIVPGYQELESQSTQLCEVLRQLQQNPTPPAWTNAQKAWLETMLAARRIQWLQSGPVADRECLAPLYYSKVAAFRIEELLAAPQPGTAAQLENASPMAKGLFAMESLLYPDLNQAPARWVAPGVTPPPSARPAELNTPPRRALLLGLAEELQRKVHEVHSDWVATNRTAAAALYATGDTNSFNQLVIQLARAIGNVEEERLFLVMNLPAPINRQIHRIEGARSSTSLLQITATLEGVRTAFRGDDVTGLKNHLRQVDPALVDRLEAQFEKSLQALQAVDVPLECAPAERPQLLRDAAAAVHELELLFKADLGKALGITITASDDPC